MPTPEMPRPPAPRQSRHGRITAVSMMKDEGPFVLEWVAHHLALGFTDLVVYTNDCSDGTDLMLRRLEALGLAHHRANTIAPGMRPQPSALNHAEAEPIVQKADWLLVLDADEFLCIRHGDGTLDGMIDAIEAAGANGMVITWRIFGSGGIEAWSRAPVTEQYLRAAPRDWNKGWGVKTLFRYDPKYWRLGIHRPKMRSRWHKSDFPASVRWLNGSGAPMPDYFKFRGWRSVARTLGYDWAQINHYAVKSIESYAMRKLRGNVNFKKDKYNSDYWALQDRNEDFDDTILRHAEARQQIFEGLLADPELARLHHAALARAEAQLAEFKSRPDYPPFVDGLRAASAVPIGAVVAKPPQARDRKKIAALMADVGLAPDSTADEAPKDAAGPAPTAAKPEAGAGAGLPVILYHDAVAGAADSGADMTPVGWHANHGIELPADPRFFTMAGLAAVTAGKFQRNLARQLPRYLPKGAKLAEIGAASGFLSSYLGQVRPDLTLVAQESTPALAQLMTAVHNRASGLAILCPGGDPGAADWLARWLIEGRFDALILGAPNVAAEGLAQAVNAGAPKPRCVVITGRALGTAAAEEAAALCASWGLTRPLPFDASGALGFAPPRRSGGGTS